MNAGFIDRPHHLIFTSFACSAGPLFALTTIVATSSCLQLLPQITNSPSKSSTPPSDRQAKPPVFGWIPHRAHIQVRTGMRECKEQLPHTASQFTHGTARAWRRSARIASRPIGGSMNVLGWCWPQASPFSSLLKRMDPTNLQIHNRASFFSSVDCCPSLIPVYCFFCPWPISTRGSSLHGLPLHPSLPVA